MNPLSDRSAFRIVRGWFLGLGLALLSIPAVSLPARAGSLIFFLESRPAGCRWKLSDARGRESRLWFSTMQCPDQVVWDKAQKRVVYSMAQGLYVSSWNAGEDAQLLGDVSPTDDFWISAETGAIRKLSWVELQSENLVQRGDNLYFQFKQELFPISRQAADGSGMAVVEEWGESGWQPVAARSLKQDDFNVTGTELFRSLRDPRPDSFSLNDLLQTSPLSGRSARARGLEGAAVWLPPDIHWNLMPSYDQLAKKSRSRL